MIKIEKNIYILFFLFLSFTSIFSQPSTKYRPFDWLVFKESGKILSLSEGYEFLYIATEKGGICRYNLYSNQYDFPITRAQGLISDEVSSVHFDQDTGILWASTNGFIQYSYTREADWTSIDFDDLGLRKNDRINRMGNSENYIWAQANSVYVKMDKSSGVLAGIFPIPDELKIQWSGSDINNNLNKILDALQSYNVMAGWNFSGTKIIDKYGRYIDIISFLDGKHNNIWLGTSDGTLFQGSKVMETFFPSDFGIRGTNISALDINGDNLWIGSKDYNIGRGISKLNISNFQSDHYDFDITINMDLTEVHSIYNNQREIWVGGNGVVLYYNFEDNYWRTLGEDRGVPNSEITCIVGDSNYVWMGSEYGIRRFSLETKREISMGFEYLFHNHPIYDLKINFMGVWIASRTGIYLYDKNNPQIMNALSIGDSYLDFPISRVSSIYEEDNILYFATNIGIIIFNINDKNWTLLIPAAQYKYLEVTDFLILNNFCFLTTSNGLFRINLKTNHIREYNFDFVGNLNTIVNQGKFLWLGTSEGLIRFNWRKDY